MWYRRKYRKRSSQHMNETHVPCNLFLLVIAELQHSGFVSCIRLQVHGATLSTSVCNNSGPIVIQPMTMVLGKVIWFTLGINYFIFHHTESLLSKSVTVQRSPCLYLDPRAFSSSFLLLLSCWGGGGNEKPGGDLDLVKD